MMPPLDEAQREQLGELLQDLLACIPPVRPVEVISGTLLCSELSLASVDGRFLAGLTGVGHPPGHLPSDEQTCELLALIRSVRIDHLRIRNAARAAPPASDNNALACLIRNVLIGSLGSSISAPKPATEAALPASPCHRIHSHSHNPDVSESEETASVKSAIGRIPPMFVPVRPVPPDSRIGKGRVGSKLRINRDSLSGGRVPQAIESLLDPHSTLGRDAVLALREVVDNAASDPSVFPLACRVANEIGSVPGQVVFVATAFVLRALVGHLDRSAASAPLSPVLPFSLDVFLGVALGRCRSAGSCSEWQFECRTILLTLSAVLRVQPSFIDQSVISCIGAFAQSLLEDKAVKKTVSSAFKELFVLLVSASSLKHALLVDFLDAKSTLQSDPKFSVDVLMAVCTGLGGRETLPQQNIISRWLAEMLWSRLIEQKLGSDRRDACQLVLQEMASSVCSKAKYPAVSICQHLLPLCLRGLSKESDLDIFTRCRIIDFLGNITYALMTRSSADSSDDDSVFNGPWLDLYDAWIEACQLSGSSHRQRLREAMLFKSVDKIYAFLLSLTCSDSVNIRLKALRCRGLFSGDVDGEKKSTFTAILALKLSDPSPAVRECALDILGRDSGRLLSSNSELFETDPSGSVQKRALRIIGQLLSRDQVLSPDCTLTAVASLLSMQTFASHPPSSQLAAKEKGGHDIYGIVRDFWFVRRLKALGPLAADWSKTMLWELSEDLLKVMQRCSSSNILQKLFGEFLSDPSLSSERAQIVSFMEASVESIIDKMMSLAGGLDDPVAADLLSAASAFSLTDRRIIEPHLPVVQHYLSSKHSANVDSAVSLLSMSCRQVSAIVLESLDGVVESLTRIVLTGSESAVRSAIDCLYVHCERCKGDFGLILRLWEKFSKYLKTGEANAVAANGNGNGNGNGGGPSQLSASQARALFSLGCLCRHSIRPAGRLASDPGPIPSHVRSAASLFIRWYQTSPDAIVQTHALQALAMAVNSVPELAGEALVLDAFHSILTSRNCPSRQSALVLSCLLEILSHNKEPCDTATPFDPTAANRPALQAAQSIVTRRYLNLLLERALLLPPEGQILLLRIFERLFLLAATNPFDIIPTVMALSASPEYPVRREVGRLIDLLFDRYPSMAAGQTLTILGLCYRASQGTVWTFNSEVSNDTSPGDPDDLLIGPLSLYYERISERRLRGRSDFVAAVLRAMTDDGTEIASVAWLSQAVSLVAFRTHEEAVDLLKGLDTASALLADAIFTHQNGMDAPELPALLRFIILSRLSRHLSKTCSSLLSTPAASVSGRKQALRARPRPFVLSTEWQTATPEECYQEAMQIIEEDVIRVSLDELEQTSEHSMKSPTLLSTTNRRRRSAKKAGARKQANPRPKVSTADSHASTGPIRQSLRSARKPTYYESSSSDAESNGPV